MNKKLKFSLIIQAFTPLFILVCIGKLDIRFFENIGRFFSEFTENGLIAFALGVQSDYIFVFILLVLAIVWIVSGVICYCILNLAHDSGFYDTGEKVKITKEISETGITFFMTYILPLLFYESSNLNEFLVFIGVLILIIMLMWKTNLFYRNPVLIILGYKIYEIEFIQEEKMENSKGTSIAISRGVLEEKKIVKWKNISDNIYLMYNKNN